MFTVALWLAACTQAPTQPVPTLHPPIAPTAMPADPSAIRYEVNLSQAASQHVSVEARLPVDGPQTEVFLPSWTPGSYLMREYARHVVTIEATDAAGKPLPIAKISKGRWRIDTAGQDAVWLRYQLWAGELSVRGNFTEADRAVLNGAATYITRPELLDRPYELAFTAPDPAWEAWSSLTPLTGTPLSLSAPNYHSLVDSPVLLGTPDVKAFTVAGVEHTLVSSGGDGTFLTAKAAEDTARLAQEVIAFWGGAPPYPHYTYLNVLSDKGYGGLEHLNSTLLLSTRYGTNTPEAYATWLGLVSHEHFHAWNVKRLRPEALGPNFDYEHEVYTPSLWFSEGLTAYYDDLLVRRAGLIDDKVYLEKLSEQLAAVQTTPGTAVESLQNSSLDAWIKHYRPDANSPNSHISYYKKGAIVGFMLDARIRTATGGRKSLDDLMRLMYALFPDGFTEANIVSTATELAGQDLDPFFAAYVRGTAPLDLTEALSTFGLSLSHGDPAPGGHLGASFDGETVKTVPTASPAEQAGLIPGDELLAIDGERVRASQLQDRLKARKPGDPAMLTIARNGRLTELDVTLGPPLKTKWDLSANAQGDAPVRRQSWLRTSVK